MKVQKWTVGLAAAGVVSLASVAQAEESKSSLETALSGTTLSGYVDVGFNWNFGGDTGNLAPATSFGGTTKGNGFNLNVVNLKLEKPLDDSGWAAGYTVEMWLGPDANALGTASTSSIGGIINQATTAAGFQTLTSSDFAIKQAYVALRAPIGNGIDFKVGVFDTIIGYEVANGPSNPNISRSFGISVEPFQHTGLLASYEMVEGLSVTGGIAGQAASSTINGRNSIDVERVAYMGALAYTASEDTGFLAGSTIYAGLVGGENGAGNAVGGTANDKQINYYVGITLATPVAGMKIGAAFDYVQDPGTQAPVSDDIQVYGLYASYQATEKLSFHGRAEYLALNNNGNELVELTGTAQYDLWENVLARIEFRWDHSVDGTATFGGTGGPVPAISAGASAPVTDEAYTLLAQFVYKF